MQILIDIGVLLLAYLAGAIPFGLLIVKIATGKDLRQVESGRTGGTNAMRAAGCSAGALTGILDVAKGFAAVWAAQALSPTHYAVHVLAGLAVILGHNHSVFLPEYDEQGRLVRLRGGAGGAPSMGGAMGLWLPSIFFTAPLAALIFFTLGIASVTTMGAAALGLIVFAVAASRGLIPTIYVLYPVLSELLFVLALQSNIKKLLAGQERVVKYSLYGRMRARRTNSSSGDGSS